MSRRTVENWAKKLVRIAYPLTLVLLCVLALPAVHGFFVPEVLSHKFTKLMVWVFSFSALVPVCAFFPRRERLPGSQPVSFEDGGKTDFGALFFLLVASSLVMAICATTSPLYPFHLWDDSNCFFTVGKSVLKGKVIYRDIYEQKGPLIYFLHTLASIISFRTFFGIYIFEVISCTFFLYFCFKILRLFGVGRNVLFLLPIWAAVAFSSRNFEYGDSVEEFSLALISYPLYCSMKNIMEKRDFSFRELFLVGVCAGIVFWMKFTLVSFFIGWATVPVVVYVRQRRVADCMKSFAHVLFGVAAVSAPVVLYFVLAGGFFDLMAVYFFGKAGYMKSANMIFATVGGTVHFFYRNYQIALMILCSAIFLCRRKNFEVLMHIICCYGFTSFFIFGFGERHAYTSLILNVFSIFCVIPFHDFFHVLFARIDVRFCWKNRVVLKKCIPPFLLMGGDFCRSCLQTIRLSLHTKKTKCRRFCLQSI